MGSVFVSAESDSGSGSADVKRMSLFLSIHFRQLAELVIGVPIALLFWSTLLYVWFLFKSLRFFVQILLNVFVKVQDRNQKVSYTLASGSDSVFGYKSQNNCNSVIPGYCVVQGHFDYNLISMRTQEMVAGNPKLKQRFLKKLGFYFWEKNDDAFDIRNHVRIVTAPEEAVTEERMVEILEELAIVPINEEHPLWELLLIPSFRSNNAADKREGLYAQILRVHHSYGDGVSFCLTSNAYLFDSPAKLPLDPKKSFPVPKWAIALQYVKVVLLGPLYFLSHILHFIKDDSKFSVAEYSPSKFMARSKVPVKLTTLKQIKRNSDASVTAILISSISASLRVTHQRLFPAHDVPPNLNTANVNAMLPYPDDHICNRFTVFPFPAPFAETNAETRLEKTNEAGYKVTLSPDPIFCYFIMKVVGNLPAFLQTLLLNISGTPIMLSNIPGIVDRVRVFNGVVVDSGAWLPLIRFTGVAVATYTYCGELRFCGMADPKVFPRKSDLQQFLDGIVEEVHQLALIYSQPSHTATSLSDKRKDDLFTDERKEIKLVQRYATSKKA